MKSIVSFLKKHPAIPLLVLVNVVFLLLYRHFIFHNAVYMYSDGGSDSLSSSYPIITMLSHLFESGTYSHFTLWDGLGIDTTAIFLQYLNPLKALLLLFGRDGFPVGIMIFVFLVTNITALLGYGFFKKILGDGRAALFASLAWAFSSYITIWGQNYSFSMNILLFTLSMFVLECWLSSHSIPAFVGLIATLALFFLSNYYFLYMTGIFMAGYTFLRTILVHRARLRGEALFVNTNSNIEADARPGNTEKNATSDASKNENASESALAAAGNAKTGFLPCLLSIMKEELFLALSAIAALILAAPAVVAVYYSLFGSARTKGGLGLAGALYVYEPEFFLSFLSRLFSPNLLGIDRAFTGPVNYFEVAFLSSSLLFLFALAYLIVKKKTRILTLVLTIVAILMLATPVASYILTQATLSQRYSFLLIFGECIAIGAFARDLFRTPDRKALRGALIAVPIFAALVFGLLIFVGPTFGIAVSSKSTGYVLVFMAVYEAALLLFFFRDSLRRYVRPALALVLAAELIVLLTPSLYEREYLTRETFATSFFSDGTRGAVEEVKREDKSLYRIETTTDYNYANEGQVDRFNSVHGYYNTNPESILTLTNAFGATQLSTSFLLLGHQHYYLFTLLSGKYKIVDKEDTPTLNAIDKDLYEAIRDSYDCITYKNKNALPFGYVYDRAYDGKTLYWTPAKDRIRLLANGYYMTSWATPPTPVTDTEEALGELSQGDSVDLFPAIYHTNDCVYDIDDDGILRIHPTGPDPYLMFNVEGVEDTGSHFLAITAEFGPTNSSDFEYFAMSHTNPAPPDCQHSTFTLNTSTSSAAFLIPDDIIGIRIDLNTQKDVLLSELAIETLPDASKDFESLKKTKISNISLENDTYHCKVTGNTENSVLCVPILYTGRWSATVDGKPADVLNINGGLCGIHIGEGEHEVVMHYSLPFFQKAFIPTFVMAALLLACLVFWFVRRKKKNH